MRYKATRFIVVLLLALGILAAPAWGGANQANLQDCTTGAQSSCGGG